MARDLLLGEIADLLGGGVLEGQRPVNLQNVLRDLEADLLQTSKGTKLADIFPGGDPAVDIRLEDADPDAGWAGVPFMEGGNEEEWEEWVDWGAAA